ncbi:MAG: hypothetical protein ABI054_09940, partial [Planctomycetota bacterium]
MNRTPFLVLAALGVGVPIALAFTPGGDHKPTAKAKPAQCSVSVCAPVACDTACSALTPVVCETPRAIATPVVCDPLRAIATPVVCDPLR